MLYAGLDLSRQRVDVHVLDEAGRTVEVTAVHPDTDGLRSLVDRIARYGEPVEAAIESMNGARFVHDTLEFAGWDVAIADALRAKGLAPLVAKSAWNGRLLAAARSWSSTSRGRSHRQPERSRPCPACILPMRLSISPSTRAPPPWWRPSCARARRARRPPGSPTTNRRFAASSEGSPSRSGCGPVTRRGPRATSCSACWARSGCPAWWSRPRSSPRRLATG